MKEPPPPAWQDRLAGAYCRPRCPHCHTPPGPDCADQSRRKMRHVEKDELRRYADTAWQGELAAADAENDITDCQHGCNGRPAPCWNERCNFTCHTDDPEQSGYGDVRLDCE